MKRRRLGMAHGLKMKEKKKQKESGTLIIEKRCPEDNIKTKRERK